MTATVHNIEVARIKRAARLVNAAVHAADACDCGCGQSLDIDKRVAHDRKTGRTLLIACWLRETGVLP